MRNNIGDNYEIDSEMFNIYSVLELLFTMYMQFHGHISQCDADDQVKIFCFSYAGYLLIRLGGLVANFQPLDHIVTEDAFKLAYITKDKVKE